MRFKSDPVALEGFVWTHLRHIISKPVGDFHRELMAATTSDRIAIAAPRGFSKSSWLSFFYPLFMLLENPGIQIFIISATKSLAVEWLGKIKRELEGNQTLKEYYGDKEKGSSRWTTEELKFADGSRIGALGAGSQIRGRGPDILILDDAEEDEAVLNPERRDAFENWILKEVLGTQRGVQGLQVIMIGTILHPESFLMNLIQHGRAGWKTRLYRAIKEDGSSLWPEMWPLSLLSAQKEALGTYAFEQEYMNNPIPEDKRVFQEKWFRYYDKLPPSGVVYFTTIDPAIEIKHTNDYTAIVTCAIDVDENIYVVDIVNARMLPGETIDRIFKLYQAYRPAVIGIETNGFQKMLRYNLDKQKKERKLYPVIKELRSYGRRKNLRIEALQPFFEAGKVLIKKEHHELIRQLKGYPTTRYDDILDALAFQLDIFRAAPKAATKLNPECFIATVERNRQAKAPAVWGNHKLRKH